MPEEVKKSLIGDLAGLSEPLKKLVEVVSSGVGRFTDAMWFAKRDADNEAYKILKVGDAQTQVVINRMKAVGAIGGGNTPQVQKLTLTGNEVNAELSDGQQAILALKERSDNRAEYQNLIHQLNTEHVIGFAAEELKKEGKTVSEEPVDPDWIGRFFNIIQDVSSEEAQLLWGKVLAGEVEKPNTFSLRTLEVLRNLSQKEAQLFQKACSYIIVYKSGEYTLEAGLIKGHNNSEVYKDLGFSEVTTLMECGLLQATFNAGITVSRIDSQLRFIWRIADKVVLVSGTPTGEFTIPIIPLTGAGFEISKLVIATAPIEYLKRVTEIVSRVNLETHYAIFKKWADNMNVEVEGNFMPL